MAKAIEFNLTYLLNYQQVDKAMYKIDVLYFLLTRKIEQWTRRNNH